MRVLVFPSCNEPGLEVVDALRLHHRIEVFGGSSIAPDADPSRAILGPHHHTLPSLSSPAFRAEMEAFCQAHAIDVLFPTIDAVVAEVARWDFVRVIAPTPALADRLLSKSKTYTALDGIVPLARPFDGTLPAFAKPDVGSGSRGARVIRTHNEAADALAAGHVVQALLPGEEYTVDCVGDADGKLLAASVRHRQSIAGGIARSTHVRPHPSLENAVARIADRLPIAGPWFAQFKEDEDGTPRLLEVNARVAGSSGATRLAGVNIPLLAVLSFTGVSVVAPRRIDDLHVVRKLDRRGNVTDYDLIIWDLDDTLVHAHEQVDPDAVAWLYRFAQWGKRQVLISRNVDPTALLQRTHIPTAFFEQIIAVQDKVPTVRTLLDSLQVAAARTIMINDSGAEKILFDHEIPAIRTVAPDAIAVLARG